MPIAVSVIIPNLDSPTVDRAVRAVQAQRGLQAAPEVIVVGRDLPGRLAGLDGLRFLATDRPRLPGDARNLGIAAAGGEVLAFTDADCEPEPDWLAAHLARQAAGSTVVGGSVLYDTDSYWTLADNLSMFHECDASLPAGPRPYLPTLNLSVHRSAVRAAGLMDPELRCGEDLDWTIRLASAGHPPFFEPLARVWHRPPRADLRAVWEHWRRSGSWMVGVRRRHRSVLAAPAWLERPMLVRLLGPGIALAVTARLFGPGRPGRRHWHTLPAVYLTKLAWCWGAARPVKLR